MEKVYTFKELEEMKEATIKAAFNTLASKMGKNAYTARELSEMTGGLLTPMSIASRASCSYGWYGDEGRKKIQDCGKRTINGGRRHLAELDKDGNIVKTFWARLPETKVNIYKIYN